MLVREHILVYLNRETVKITENVLNVLILFVLSIIL